MELIRTLKYYLGLPVKARALKPEEMFFRDFEATAKSRGVVAYFQEATETKTNGAGIVEKIAIEATTTKLFILPGDNYDQVTKENLVAFEGLNRRSRKMCLEERRKIVAPTRAGMKMPFSQRIKFAEQLKTQKDALRKQELNKAKSVLQI